VKEEERLGDVIQVELEFEPGSGAWIRKKEERQG
jgi:hypothetical protein